MNLKKLLSILRLHKEDLKDLITMSKHCISGENCWLWLKKKDLPILVAHIDTVYDHDPDWANRDILHNERYVWSPFGVGGDDRVGVYLLIELFEQCDVNCLFTDYEESGALGAREACEIFEDILKHAPYFIEIDRRGYKEVVFYNNDELNQNFYNKIKKHFEPHTGTFSDIAILGKTFNICSANVSAGYYNAHKKDSEYIYLPSVEYTYKTVPKLLNDLGLTQYRLVD